jgi:phosphoglycerate-specific signal transduction histidine kinase
MDLQQTVQNKMLLIFGISALLVTAYISVTLYQWRNGDLAQYTIPTSHLSTTNPELPR